MNRNRAVQYACSGQTRRARAIMHGFQPGQLRLLVEWSTGLVPLLQDVPQPRGAERAEHPPALTVLDYPKSLHPQALPAP